MTIKIDPVVLPLIVFVASTAALLIARGYSSDPERVEK